MENTFAMLKIFWEAKITHTFHEYKYTVSDLYWAYSCMPSYVLYIFSMHVECSAFDPAKPSVTINASHNLVAYVGDDLTIDCIVASLTQSGTSAIRWFKNETEILPYGHVDYQLGDFDKIHCRQIITLEIKNLTFEDSGNYTCVSAVSNYRSVTDTMLLTVTVPQKQPDYKLLITKISIPVSVIIVLLGICMTLGFFYYLHVRQMKLQKALEEYQKRPLPNKGCQLTVDTCIHI